MPLRSLRQRLGAAIGLMAALRRDRPASNLAEALQTALESLPDPSRTVYLLHARDQVPLAVIGARLGLTPIDVTWHLSRALVHLDRQIGTISPAGAVASSSADR